MAYDELLAERLRAAVLRSEPRGDEHLDERKMFGGVTLLVNGCMACGVIGRDLVVRTGAATDRALARPHARAMDFTGKPLRGFVYVAPAGVTTEPALAEWVAAGLAGAREAARAKTSKPRQRSPTPRAGQRRARPSRER